VHTGMVYQGGEKMSKSLGNLTLVSDLLKSYSADAIRIVLQSHHYRHPWECFPQDLQEATEKVELFQHIHSLVGRQAAGEDTILRNRVKAALNDDLDTPGALLLLKQAAETVAANHDLNTGAEIVRLTTMLGLCV
jgi:cysteinyl-tRNA synthetase